MRARERRTSLWFGANADAWCTADRKTSSTPRRPFEKERLDQELKLLGEYGLRCKNEIWRVQLTLAKARKAARKLLTLDESDPKRMYEGDALVRRMLRYGMLSEESVEGGRARLDDVLSLTTQRMLERRLQTIVHKMKLCPSIHAARTYILQRHIRVGKQMVTSPSYLVRTASEGHIDFAATSPFASTGRPGRVKRRTLKTKEA